MRLCDYIGSMGPNMLDMVEAPTVDYILSQFTVTKRTFNFKLVVLEQLPRLEL